jgi:hypothetical protein
MELDNSMKPQTEVNLDILGLLCSDPLTPDIGIPKAAGGISRQ